MERDCPTCTDEMVDAVRTNIGKLYGPGDGPTVTEVLQAIPDQSAKVGGQWVTQAQVGWVTFSPDGDATFALYVHGETPADDWYPVWVQEREV